MIWTIMGDIFLYFMLIKGMNDYEFDKTLKYCNNSLNNHLLHTLNKLFAGVLICWTDILIQGG